MKMERASRACLFLTMAIAVAASAQEPPSLAGVWRLRQGGVEVVAQLGRHIAAIPRGEEDEPEREGAAPCAARPQSA